jgi:hypothetical protein
MLRRSVVLLTVLGVIAAFGLTACGSGSSSGGTTAALSQGSGHVHFAKTKFLFHAGLAFGAFHHWIYEPIKAGDLRHPFLHKLALIKAGLASLFVYHELKLAAVDVRSSKVLRTLFAPLIAVANKIRSLKSSLAGGSANPADIQGLNSQLGSVGQTAASNGQKISDSVPSASQLLSGG